MPLVKLIAEDEATGRVKEIYEDIKTTYGLRFVPNAYKAMAVYPEFLEAEWRKIKALRTRGELSAREKEILALAVSATNGCDYCIDAHTAILKRIGLSDRAIVELMAVVDHYNGLNAFLEGLQIESDIKP
ncbi:MAG: carboxymuconolactone decarboxylase family protein [Acidobacteria bacterium]|nr:carboxymuconolactone decarboxylase family protein [Acidobacteriota bacterium]